ncbi:hypothetical protein [Cryptosporangium sp. NPDC048952]|uniref:hypothetical protein n=1 Tax=Cryptosporangium sp. NPDC048952 TaxID=3363961 RepID=UPI00371302CD
MMLLDCEDAETALRSLAHASGVDDADFRAALLARNPDRTVWTGDEDPWVAIPRVLLADLGVEIGEVRFDGAYYFHGTRTLRPHAFLHEGILPLGAALDRLWSDLHDLCDGDVTNASWMAFRQQLEGGIPTPLHSRHGAYLYRMKFANDFHHGPYASLIRDHTIDPIEGQHDYVKSPEIVEDIARCVDFDLQERFEATARSCIVKFRHHEVKQQLVEAAVLYVWARIQNRPLDLGSVYGIDCRGAVPATDVVYVDEVDLSRRGGPRPTLVRRHRAPDCSATDLPCASTPA